MADKPLTDRQAAFIREYLVDMNATQAAIRAGYSEGFACQSAGQLKANPVVAAAIQAEIDKRAERTRITADTVLAELLRIARVDIGEAFNEDGSLKPIKEIPEDVRRAIAGCDVSELWGAGMDGGRAQIGVLKKVKFLDKTRALELLGKHLRLFADRIEVDTSDALADKLAAAQARLAAKQHDGE